MWASRLHVRLARIAARIGKSAAALLGRSKNVYVWDRVPFYRDMWRKAADRNSLEFVTLSEDVWELRKGGQCVSRINNCYVELDDPVTLYIAGDKPLTYALLSEAGLPVPPHAVFTLDSLDVLQRFLSEQRGPFVIKPASGTGSGIGVTTHLRTWRQCLSAAALASLYCRKLLVERLVPGEVYRLLFVNGCFVSAVCRPGLRVTGDGRTPLENLVVAAFESRPELGGYVGWTSDLDLRATTRAQGLEAKSILPEGSTVLVKSVAQSYVDNVEIRTVYTEDVTDAVCPELVEEARIAAKALRSQFCGVDVITTDRSRSLRSVGGVVGEVNTTPGLHHHYLTTTPERGDLVVDAVVDVMVGARKRQRALA